MNTENSALKANDIFNVPYGTHPLQVIDVYLPEGRDNTTKVFLLVHGGGWSGGSKSQLDYIIPILKNNFPKHAIVNLNYRLATAESPAFPKQIQDIEKAIQFLKESDYGISNAYAFVGLSAGAHLAMLYSYKYDIRHEVKTVASIVGPADFTDPYYTAHPYYQFAALYLLGDVANHPEAAIGISPAVHINAQSPATILFYGGKDPLVPASQGRRLKAKLDEFNVPNQYYLNAAGGHANWNAQAMATFQAKLVDFLHKHF